MNINCSGKTKVAKVEAIDRNRLGGSGEPPLPELRNESGFALVVALIMVALMAVIAVGVLTTVSVERGTATSYSSRYQADLATQNGLQAAAKTLAAAPFPSPVPVNFNATVTGNDAFLVVRADGPADANGNKAAYYYLAQPAPTAGNSITYYPLFSASSDPSDPSVVQTQTINLAAPSAPAVPTPAPPPNSNSTDPTAAWNAAGTQRLPTLYSWVQPSPTPSGPSVKWVEMRDPQDAPSPAPHNLPYTRYAYWVEDLDGYLDASQVSDPLYVNARAGLSPSPSPSPYTVGTSSKEIAMFTIFNPAQQLPAPTPAPVINLVSNRPLLLTVPTLQQVAQSSPSPAPSPDVAGPNLAVRLGVDNGPGEQNLVPLGYGYSRDDTLHLGEGYTKTPINPVSQLRPQGNQIGAFAAGVNAAMPNFANRTVITQPSGHGHSGHTRNYFNNLTANILDYAYPLDAPTEFNPNGNNNPPSSRGIGAYPFVVSLYDLNNWVQTVPIGSTYGVVIETKTYVQLWNPHNYPAAGLAGALTLHYQNSDQVSVNGTLQTLSSPPDATVIFKDNPDPNNRSNPVIVSPLFETGNVNLPFNYQIRPAIGYQDPQGKIKPNEYRVVALPGPTPACTPTGTGRNIYTYSATCPSCPNGQLPPGLNLHGGGAKAGLIDGTPTPDPPYTNGYRDYSVTITATGSPCGTASATLVIRIYQ